MLDICANFAVSNFIIFNEKKTMCMCFKLNSLNGLFVPTLCLYGVLLTFVTSNTYLGVTIHDKHQDDDDIMRYVKSLCSGIIHGSTCLHAFQRALETSGQPVGFK